MIDGRPHKIGIGDGTVVHAGAHHNVVCTGHEALELYTIYGPAHHRDQFIQTTKTEADASDEAFQGHATVQIAETVRV